MRHLFLIVLLCCACSAGSATAQDRVRAMLLGSLIGDAAGGPHEFQPAARSFWTATDTALSTQGIADLASRIALRQYTTEPAPYGPWRTDAGTVTDDSRFKILFFRALSRDPRLDPLTFAAVIDEAQRDTTGPFAALRSQWLAEFAAAARWVLGKSANDGALPPERAWGGMATMAGQMPFLPVAALHSGDPDAAYRTVWRLDFLDNGVGRDLNAALVAGVAAALGPGATWGSVEAAMRATDPYRFGAVPWVPRALDRWLDTAHSVVSRSDGRAARLFALLEAELGAVTWWEAWVPMTVVFAVAEFARYDPLATMQLLIEFGHDTDSYMQVAGALFGALHGSGVFPAQMRETVERRLAADFDVRLDDWVRLIATYSR